MGEKLKLHKSVPEQIEHLKVRGVLIDDECKAEFFLSNVNYYRFSGYLHEFRKPGSSYYIDGTSLNRIIELYRFDCKFTRILMYILEDVEETLKARLSYTLSSLFPSDPLIYLDSSIYRDRSALERFKILFYKSKADDSDLPFIKHHNEKYDGQLPIWVAVEIFTMGNIHKLYDNLKGKYQKTIARTYNTGSMQLRSWIRNMTYTRNHVAHYMRVYGYNFGRVPVQCDKHPSFSQTGMIFDQILCAGFMFSDKEEWKSYVIPEIERLFSEYQKSIELSDLGFPADWKEILGSV